MVRMRNGKVLRRRGGAFSLTEMVFALMVLAVGMVPVMGMLIISQRVSQQAQIQRIAYNVARYQLERVTSESFANCSSPLSNCNAINETSFAIPPSLTGNIPHGVTLNGTYSVSTTSSTTMRQVSVRVYWTNALSNSANAGPASEVRLSTLIAQQPSP